MENQMAEIELTCYCCKKGIDQKEMKPVQIGSNSVKPYCPECLLNLKSEIKEDKSRFRSWMNYWFKWDIIIPTVIVISAIIILIGILGIV